ncbi:hypothetical protein [Micromonospora arborensis]|uniref:hypothetical protein n=1 Tax=Micromonospora arborensis TaxID=2116518 RepID=UPI0037103E9A
MSSDGDDTSWSGPVITCGPNTAPTGATPGGTTSSPLSTGDPGPPPVDAPDLPGPGPGPEPEPEPEFELDPEPEFGLVGGVSEFDGEDPGPSSDPRPESVEGVEVPEDPGGGVGSSGRYVGTGSRSATVSGSATPDPPPDDGPPLPPPTESPTDPATSIVKLFNTLDTTVGAKIPVSITPPFNTNPDTISVVNSSAAPPAASPPDDTT